MVSPRFCNDSSAVMSKVQQYASSIYNALLSQNGNYYLIEANYIENSV